MVRRATVRKPGDLLNRRKLAGCQIGAARSDRSRKARIRGLQQVRDNGVTRASQLTCLDVQVQENPAWPKTSTFRP